MYDTLLPDCLLRVGSDSDEIFMNTDDLLNIACDFDEVDYCRFFSLLESPFCQQFDCSKFYQGANRISAVEDILLRIEADEPFVYVKSEPGQGKTALCRMVEQQLAEGLCLYANCSGRTHRFSVEKQLSGGLLLDADTTSDALQIEEAISGLLKLHGRLVILLEGIVCINSEQLAWLCKLSSIAQDLNKPLSIVFFFSQSEQEVLQASGFNTEYRQIELDNLTEYEVYEYLNNHMQLCGHDRSESFPRKTSQIMAAGSMGNFAKLVTMADSTLRHSYRRREKIPSIGDVPVVINQNPSPKKESRGDAVLTAKDTVLMGALSGCIILVFFWGIFGSV